jgi:hypothetical protein
MYMPVDTLSPQELKERLAHVLWIGGGTDAGKTSLARLFAARYDIHIYHFDRPSPSWEAITISEDQYPHSLRWQKMTDEERWLRPAKEQAQHVYQMWAEQYSFRLHDLLTLPIEKRIVAEGYGFMPSLVAPLLASQQQAIWLVPTAAFKEKTFKARVSEGAKGSYRHQIQNPEKALARHRERDMLIADRIREEATARNLRLLTVDGSNSLAEVFTIVEDHFKPYLGNRVFAKNPVSGLRSEPSEPIKM